jgi:hypothetical protein
MDMPPGIGKLLGYIAMFVVGAVVIYAIKRSNWQSDQKLGGVSKKPTLLKEAVEMFKYLNKPKK